MSGECLCGSFAKPGEREELAFWFPDFESQLRQLETRVAGVPGIPEHRQHWGWGATVREPDRRLAKSSGPLRHLWSTCTTGIGGARPAAQLGAERHNATALPRLTQRG